MERGTYYLSKSEISMTLIMEKESVINITTTE